MSSSEAVGASIASTVALVINVLVLVGLLGAMGYLLWMMNRKQRREFLTVAIKLIKARKQMKRSRLSLEEFLHLCNILGITQNKIAEIYQDLHRRRREMGESWLFDTNLGKSVAWPMGDRPEGGLRSIPIFQTFAYTSQFTQGFEGYRMHRLLHGYRRSECVSENTPEMRTYYEVSAMCSTMRKSHEAYKKKIAAGDSSGKDKSK